MPMRCWRGLTCCGWPGSRRRSQFTRRSRSTSEKAIRSVLDAPAHWWPLRLLRERRTRPGGEEMHSNFESPLKITEGVVEACGELEWAGESEAFVTVTLTQRDAPAVGGASSRSSFKPPDDE